MKPYTLPLALFYFRRLRGHTQAQLAELSGVTQDYISRIEKSQKQPSLETLEKLLTSLHSSFSEFFTVAEIIAQLRADKAAIKLVTTPTASDQIAGTVHQLQQQLESVAKLQQALTTKDPSPP